MVCSGLQNFRQPFLRFDIEVAVKVVVVDTVLPELGDYALRVVVLFVRCELDVSAEVHGVSQKDGRGELALGAGLVLGREEGAGYVYVSLIFHVN